MSAPRRVWVNTLAFRLAQHRRFFNLDADCVPSSRFTRGSSGDSRPKRLSSTPYREEGRSVMNENTRPAPPSPLR